MNNFKVMMNGIIKENPTFVLLLVCVIVKIDSLCH